MSLDVTLLETKPVAVYEGNITHNLAAMADDAGLYLFLWRPEEVCIKYARELIPHLEEGLALLKSQPTRFKKFNPSNLWGDYEYLVKFVEQYLEACREHPDAEVEVDR